MVACPICSTALPAASISSPDRGNATPGRFEVATCPECGAGVTLPLVGPDELAAFYPGGYGPHSQADRPFVALLSRAIQRWLGFLAWRRPPLAALRDRRIGRGLDVGAGRGDTATMLAARGWAITAIEPSPAAAAQIRSRGVDALDGVLATVELEGGIFDFALFQHSLEHTIDPLADLRRVHAALAPGGLVLIIVPNFASWQRRIFRGCWYHLDLPRHRVHFTGPALARALRDAGFDEVVLTRSSSAVGLPASLQYRLAGRCLFPDGLGLRIASGLCVLTLPLSALLDRMLGEGDTLAAVARRAVVETDAPLATSARRYRLLDQF
jgi:SAM-dependent methyltransferase